MSIKQAVCSGLLIGLALLSQNPALAKTIPVESIVAVVDEDVILKSELDSRVSRIKQGADPSQLPPDDVLITQVLERLIVENLELQTAKRAGVRISDQELNEAMTAIAQQNSLNMDQFRQALAADGIEYSDMRNQIRREMQISRVQRGVMNNRIQVSEQEIDNLLQSELGELITSDEYNVFHILLAVDESASAAEIKQASDRAQALVMELRKGADFNRAAIANSAGQNALEGGDLGWRKPAQMPSLFSDTAQNMKIGEISEPIKSASGYHIIKLANKRGAKAEGKIAQTRTRHILIKTSEILSDEEAREFAEQLLSDIKGGADFAELAQKHSKDPSSALSGGDLNWNQAGVFVPEFELAISSLEIDEISDVVKSQHGYHIVQVTGRRIEDFSKEFQRNQAANFLRNKKFEEELESWLREIREDAFVEIRI